MLIGELSRRTGVSRRLLRYYEEQGLLNVTRRANGYRDYGDDAVTVVQRVRLLLDAGLPTEVIQTVLPCVRGTGQDLEWCTELRRLLTGEAPGARRPDRRAASAPRRPAGSPPAVTPRGRGQAGTAPSPRFLPTWSATSRRAAIAQATSIASSTVRYPSAGRCSPTVPATRRLAGRSRHLRASPAPLPGVGCSRRHSYQALRANGVHFDESAEHLVAPRKRRTPRSSTGHSLVTWPGQLERSPGNHSGRPVRQSRYGAT